MTASAAATDCDRACLRGFITQYLDAILTHNPNILPLSDKVRFTEDTMEMKLGEGLWKNASKIRSYRQDILDVRKGVAASQVVVEEDGMPALFVLRLKIADREDRRGRNTGNQKAKRRRIICNRCASNPRPCDVIGSREVSADAA